jgi:hypothetical protein
VQKWDVWRAISLSDRRFSKMEKKKNETSEKKNLTLRKWDEEMALSYRLWAFISTPFKQAHFFLQYKMCAFLINIVSIEVGKKKERKSLPVKLNTKKNELSWKIDLVSYRILLVVVNEKRWIKNQESTESTDFVIVELMKEEKKIRRVRLVFFFLFFSK